MKYVVNDQLVLSRPPEGPLAGHIVSFAKSTIRNQVLIATGFSQWLRRERIGLSCIGATLRAQNVST